MRMNMVDQKKSAMARAPSPAREARALPGSGILSRGVISGLVGFSRGGNYLDFHIGSFR
jgi:hypothetical protein